MKGRRQTAFRQEQGYALISVLLLVAILFVIGTLVMQAVTNSQGMVNVSEDIVSAQADGETKLLIKLSELRAAVMALKEKDKVTLDDVKAAAAKYVEPGTVTLDNENQRYVAIVKADGVSDQVTQTYRRRVEIILNDSPDDPNQPGSGGSEFALVSRENVELNGKTTVIGNVFAKSGLNNNGADVQGKILAPNYPKVDLAPPSQVDIAAIIQEVRVEAENAKNALLKSNPNPQELTLKSGTQTIEHSAVFSNVTLQNGSRLSVNGDLVITGTVNMHNDNTILATGNIYIMGSVASSKCPLIQASDKIWIGGAGNFNEPHNEGITLIGDLYVGGSLDFHTKLTAGVIYVGGHTNGKLRDDSRFALYSDYDIVIDNNSNSSSLTGHVYSNKRINVNGNSGLVIRASGSSGPIVNPDKPTDIVINEDATTIN